MLLALLSCLLALPFSSVCDEVTTTSGSVFIRRKSPSSRMGVGGGGRLSLMNSRFSKRGPKKRNQDQLMELLGSHFDPAWMSVEDPGRREPSYEYRQDPPDLIRQLSNLTHELQDPGLVKTVEKWLIKRASCPVRYAWEDIGALFWPRYIRRGECISVPGTCSWPPGMHCVPSGTATLHVLRWQCKLPKGKGRRKNMRNKELKKELNKEWQKNLKGGDQPFNLKCSWIRVPYPITNECLCTC